MVTTISCYLIREWQQVEDFVFSRSLFFERFSFLNIINEVTKVVHFQFQDYWQFYVFDLYLKGFLDQNFLIWSIVKQNGDLYFFTCKKA